jgi:hypothetical protein
MPPELDAADAFLTRLGAAVAPAVRLLRDVGMQAATVVVVRSIAP